MQLIGLSATSHKIPEVQRPVFLRLVINKVKILIKKILPYDFNKKMYDYYVVFIYILIFVRNYKLITNKLNIDDIINLCILFPLLLSFHLTSIIRRYNVVIKINNILFQFNFKNYS